MKELILEGVRKVALQDTTISLPGKGEVLLQTLYSGISTGTELRKYRGETAPKRWDEALRCYQDLPRRETWPQVLGYETVARVIGVGDGVHLQEGDIVWLDQPHREMHLVCEEEASYGLLLSAKEAQGQYEDLERFIFLVRTRVALNGIHDADIRLGDRVVVLGCGVIGLLCIQLALLAGASEVYAIDMLPDRLEMAAHFGAIPISANEDAALLVKQKTRGGVDAVLEVSGTYQALAVGIRCCQVAGRVVTIGTYAGSGVLNMGEEWSKNRISLYSSMSTNGCPSRTQLWDKKRLDHYAIELLKTGKLYTTPLISHRVPFDQAEETFSWLDYSKDALQVIFTYEGRSHSHESTDC